MSPTGKHILREALLWIGAAATALALIYFFDDLQAALGPRVASAPSVAEMARTGKDEASSFVREVRLKADPRGHFVFEASINDRPTTFMADTGATLVVVTYEEAQKLGLSPHTLDFSARVETANGVSHVAPVILDRVRIEDITVRNVAAAVAEKGALATNLLGMSFLGRLERFQIQGGELVLVQ